jgi:hypothetical protein
MDRLHWQCFLAKMLATLTEYVLALSILGNVTKIETILSCVTPPKVAKASTSVSLSCVIVTGVILLTFANVNMALSRV